MAAGESEKFSRNDIPLSHDLVRLGSIGILPRNGTSNFWAIVIGELLDEGPDILNNELLA